MRERSGRPPTTRPHLNHRLDRLDTVGRPVEHLEAYVLQRPHQRQDVAVGAARIEQRVLELTVDDDEQCSLAKAVDPIESEDVAPRVARQDITIDLRKPKWASPTIRIPPSSHVNTNHHYVSRTTPPGSQGPEGGSTITTIRPSTSAIHTCPYFLRSRRPYISSRTLYIFLKETEELLHREVTIPRTIES